jgi:hypothetical protein
MKRKVCGMGRATPFEVGEVLTVTTQSDLLSRSTSHGALFKIEGYPYEKFFWWNEFEVIKRFNLKKKKENKL